MSRNNPHPSTSLRSPRRLAAVAWLCLCAQLTGMVHVMLVSHVRCAEHGEMVDVDRDVDHQSAAPVSTELTLRATALLAMEHPHDHCTAITDRRHLCSNAAAQLLNAPPSATPRPRVVIATVVTARPLYRLAPKISPPITG